MKLPIQLISERLLLRPYRENDFNPFFDFLNNHRATRFLRFTPRQKTLEGARAFFEDVMASYATYNPIFALAITLKSNGRYIGTCGLSPLSDGTGVECYYVLLPQYWGEGFAVEAINLLFDYAFTELRIDRIIALIHPENHPSRQVAYHLGMVQHGSVWDEETGQQVCCYVLRKTC